MTREGKWWVHSEGRIALKARCTHFAFPDFFKANLSVGLGSTVYRDQLWHSTSLTERNPLLAFTRAHPSHFPDSSQISSLPWEVGQPSSAVAYIPDQRGLGHLSLRSPLRLHPTSIWLFIWHGLVPIALGMEMVRVAVAEEINPSLCLNVSQIKNPVWFPPPQPVCTPLWVTFEWLDLFTSSGWKR